MRVRARAQCIYGLLFVLLFMVRAPWSLSVCLISLACLQINRSATFVECS